MTVATARARGVASVPAGDAARAATPDPSPSTVDDVGVVTWPLRPPRRVAGLPIGLLVCWQLAIALSVGAVGRPLVATVALATVAGACLAVSCWRFRGRWGHEWLRLWCAYRLRRRRLRAHDADGLELVLLRNVVRTEDVGEIEVDGAGAALVRHAAGSTAVLELSADGIVPGMLDLPTDLLPEPAGGEPEYAIQLVMHIRPVADGWESRAWLAIQAFRDAGFSDIELRHSLAATVRRTRRALKHRGYPAPPLGRARLYRDIRLLAQLDLAGPLQNAGTVAVERWDHWWTPGLSHRTIRLRSWRPRGVPPQELATTMLTAGGLGTTVALAARRVHGPGVERAAVALEFAVRVTDRSETVLATAVEKLHRDLAGAGATAERLDGREVSGLAATLPLGGFAA